MTFALILVGLAVTIIYWGQNNALNGKLKRTDTFHTVISIFQLFSLLLFLYSLRLGVVEDPHVRPPALLAQPVELEGAELQDHQIVRRHLPERWEERLADVQSERQS